jgi:hypothetical protein
MDFLLNRYRIAFGLAFFYCDRYQFQLFFGKGLGGYAAKGFSSSVEV